MGSHRIRDQGFTLIEMILVSAIIGLLASIAIPKFANMVIKAKEAAVRGKLGALRSALSIYYSDTEGIYFTPQWGVTMGTAHVYPLSILTPKYIEKIPTISLPNWYLAHDASDSQLESDGCLDTFEPGEWGGFSGVSWPGYSWSGAFRYCLPYGSNNIYIMNLKKDTGGRVWSTW